MISVDIARARARAAVDLNAFISLTDEQGDGSVAVKDLVDVRGLPTTAGVSARGLAPAEVDASVVRHLRDAGFAVVGKTNLHEWACGVTSDNPTYGRVKNPLDRSRLAGGSSGGSAAAVAASLCDWAIGTDTGGSIRIPASFCGVVGFKPTTSQLSTEGIVPVSPTLDTVGPMARDVDTLAVAFAAMAGVTPTRITARTSIPRLCIPANWEMTLDKTTRRVWSEMAAGLPTIEVPSLEVLVRVQQVIVRAEAASYHRRALTEHPESFTLDVRTFLLSGLDIARDDYQSALQERHQLSAALDHAIRDYDALLLPTTPLIAPHAGRVPPDLMRALNRFTRPFNATGHPAISVPVPTSPVPVGLQLVGHLEMDSLLLSVAARVEGMVAGTYPARSTPRRGPSVMLAPHCAHGRLGTRSTVPDGNS